MTTKEFIEKFLEEASDIDDKEKMRESLKQVVMVMNEDMNIWQFLTAIYQAGYDRGWGDTGCEDCAMAATRKQLMEGK